MSGIFGGPPGSTPLQLEDQEGLKPTWIATRGDLNRAEQENIAIATVWVLNRRWKTESFTQEWLRGLHRRMFDAVWRWAGSYRRTDANVGLPWFEIPVSVEDLIRDLSAQAGSSGLSADEVAVRFHHRLVSIHPFPNGNGRHARLAADVLVETLGGVRFDWGAGAELSNAGRVRDEYLVALRRADREGDFAPLLAFARLSGKT